MAKTAARKQRWIRRIGTSVVVALWACWAGCNGPGQQAVAYADAPAVTDFGQSYAEAAMADGGNHPHAVFLTLYADGRQQCEVRTVQDDAIVSFAGEHPAWRIDHGLTWFVRMPVYVRQLTASQTQASGETA